MSEDDADEFDRLLERYKATLKNVASLPEVPMRRAAVARVLEELEIPETVWFIDQLVRGALWGRNPEMDAMIACTDWLIQLRLDDDYERMQKMYIWASEEGRDGVLFLLRDPPPHLELAEGARLPEIRLPLPREVSVGERRSLARGTDRQLLDRLLMDPNPLVLRNLLDNPQIRVSDVLTVASRRPTTADLLYELVLHKTWFRESQIRESVVQNPYAPTGVALKMMPTLNVQVLRRIQHASDLHPLVHEAAKLLVKLREERTAPWRV